MASNDVVAKSGSVAIAGDNSGDIINIQAGLGSRVIVQRLERRLPSYLGKIIAVFAEQELSEYAAGQVWELRPEIVQKLEFNGFSHHRIITEYTKYFAVLERSYKGVEQRNGDARVLVHRKAGVAYSEILDDACKAGSVPSENRESFARMHSAALISEIVKRLMKEYAESQSVSIEEECAHLAVSLIVADAICDCVVLERPKNATSA